MFSSFNFNVMLKFNSAVVRSLTIFSYINNFEESDESIEFISSYFSVPIAVPIVPLLVFSTIMLVTCKSFEDCILNKYLKTYNQIKGVKFSNKTNYVFTESFISEEYFDKTFHIDSKLNVDILNGDLTLPIKSSKLRKPIQNKFNSYLLTVG
jgi:hypothetical protein